MATGEGEGDGGGFSEKERGGMAADVVGGMRMMQREESRALCNVHEM